MATEHTACTGTIEPAHKRTVADDDENSADGEWREDCQQVEAIAEDRDCTGSTGESNLGGPKGIPTFSVTTDHGDDEGDDPLGSRRRCRSRHHRPLHLVATGCLRRWLDKLRRNPNGGDFPKRFDSAIRAALGSCAYFSALVFSNEEIFPSIWLGNFFVQAALAKDSVGASVPFAVETLRDLVLTTGASWGVNLALRRAGPDIMTILIPFVTCILTFVIMSIPQLASKNLMVVIMWVVVQLDLREEVPDLYPLGILGTCFLGLATGVIFTLLPMRRHPAPAASTIDINELTKNIKEDAHVLFLGIQSFSLNAGTSSSTARRAVSAIELAVDRLTKSSQRMKTLAASAEVERRMMRRFCCFGGATTPGSLTRWSTFLLEQRSNLAVIQVAVTKPLLGEEFSAFSQQIREAKVSLAGNLRDATGAVVNEMSSAVDYCCSNASLGSSRAASWQEPEELARRLRDSLFDLRQAWSSALSEAESIMLDASSQPSGSGSVSSGLAFFVRRMELLYGAHKLCSGLAAYLEELALRKKETPEPPRTLKKKVAVLWQSFADYLTQPWPALTLKNYRLPLKASVGMTVASLWVVVPFLYERARPFEYWPAITVASVNLATTGSSYIKCVDRLWGTLMASAYALLVVFFAGIDTVATRNYVKILSLTLFIFAAIYFRNPKRPYASSCAAISIGSILYGSIKNNYDVPGFVTQRIALIFVGVVVSMVVEVLVFPRSSRKIVQEQVLAYFNETRHFLKEAKSVVEEFPTDLSGRGSATSDIHSNLPTTQDGDVECGALSSCEREPKPLEDLDKRQRDAEKSVAKANGELQSAIDEPVLGFSLPIRDSYWMGLVCEEMECSLQMKVLVNAIKSLQEFYSFDMDDHHVVRFFDWPTLYADMIGQALLQLEESCDQLKEAFPDGRLRPQNENIVEALNATAGFRDFDDVRLNILAIWSKRYRRFIHRKQSLPSEFGQRSVSADSLRMIVTLGLAASVILEICHRLQNAGRYVEAITRDFPQQASSSHVQNSYDYLFAQTPPCHRKSVSRQSFWISNYT